LSLDLYLLLSRVLSHRVKPSYWGNGSRIWRCWGKKKRERERRKYKNR
jgi:hypothetical protein